MYWSCHSFHVASETWTLTAELQRKIHTVEMRCFTRVLSTSFFLYGTFRKWGRTCNHHQTRETPWRATDHLEDKKTTLVWTRDKSQWPILCKHVDQQGNEWLRACTYLSGWSVVWAKHSAHLLSSNPEYNLSVWAYAPSGPVSTPINKYHQQGEDCLSFVFVFSRYQSLL